MQVHDAELLDEVVLASSDGLMGMRLYVKVTDPQRIA